jgi:hypothetical protein
MSSIWSVNPVAPSNRHHYQAPFPETPAAEETTTQPGTDTEFGIYSFRLENQTDDEGVKVLIRDGMVNGVTPTGMGNDDYILPIALDGDNVWVEVTYDTTTLTITSASLNTGTGIPDSTLGTAFLLIGYVNWDTNPNTGGPENVIPHNTQCGDINIGFIYGALNGAPALFLLSQIDDPQALS